MWTCRTHTGFRSEALLTDARSFEAVIEYVSDPAVVAWHDGLSDGSTFIISGESPRLKYTGVLCDWPYGHPVAWHEDRAVRNYTTLFRGGVRWTYPVSIRPLEYLDRVDIRQWAAPYKAVTALSLDAGRPGWVWRIAATWEPVTA